MTGEHMHDSVRMVGEVAHLLNVRATRATGLERGADECLVKWASPSEVIGVADDLMMLSPHKVESARLEKTIGY